MKLIFIFLLIIQFVFPANATTFRQVDGQAMTQARAGLNLLKNGHFEKNMELWTASGSSVKARTTTASEICQGDASGSWDASATGEFLTSTAVAIPNGMYGTNGAAVGWFKTSATDYKMQVYDGTSVLNEVTIPASTTCVPVSVNFVYPTSGNISVRLASQSNAVELDFDEMWQGKAFDLNLSNVSQAQLYGSIVINTCTGSRNNNVAGALTISGTCAYSPIHNNAAAPAANDLAVKFNSLPPGYYKLEARGQFGKTVSTTNSTILFAFHDGSSYGDASGAAEISSSSGQSFSMNSFSNVFKYTTAQGATTFQVRCSTSTTTSSTNCYTAAGLQIDVYYYPLSSDTAYKADDLNWQVIADITGANPSLGVAAVTAYTEIVDAGLTMTPVSGSAPVGIMCSTTNAATAPSSAATVCAAGSESIGANFNIPKAGWYEACFAFAHYIQTDASETVYATFNVIQTPTNAQTLTYEGGPRVPSGATTTGTDTITQFPHRSCGQINFSSAGNVGVRLMYEQGVAGTPDDSVLLADANASTGQRAIRVTVRPMIVPGNQPQTINSVMHGDAGVMRQCTGEWQATISGTTAPTRNYGTCFGSATTSGTGLYAMPITAGLFSASPTCLASSNGASGGDLCQINGAATTTSVPVACYNAAGSLANARPTIFCWGPK
jgi:hypothetical protein